jgi:hypothetical protein
VYDLNQELLEEYRSRFPSRAYLLERHPRRCLSRASCVASQLRTESLKTNQRWASEAQPASGVRSQDHFCRLSQSSRETVTHLVHNCPTDQALAAQRLLKRYYIRAKVEVPVDPCETLRRACETRLIRIRDSSLEAFLDTLDLERLLHCRLSA